MFFTRGKHPLTRKVALLCRRVKYAVAVPMVTTVMRRTVWLDGDMAPPKALNDAADGNFVEQGDELVVALDRDFAVKDGLRIMDIGCGIGRIATALLPVSSPFFSIKGPANWQKEM
jgi:hypothetical protein